MNTNSKSKGPLEGIKILDFCQLAQGPFATQILGDLGADIIKVEPAKGDWSRSFALNNLYVNGESISFLSFNRNKRSIVLDLKKDSAKAVVHKLVGKVDVVVENFRPGVMDRLGIGYDALSKVNPAIIYCASCGLGHEGPYVSRPGQDLLIQAMSGVPHLTAGEGQGPYPAPFGVADFSTGIHIVYGILAALIGRERTGKGQRVDLNLWNSLLAMISQELNTYMNGGGLPQRPRSAIASAYLGAPYGIYPTSNGFIALGMNPLNKVARLSGTPGYEEVSSSNVMEDRDKIHGDLSKHFATKTTQEWMDILLAEDVWCAPVNSFGDLMDDPQIAANKILETFEDPVAGTVKVVGVPVKFSDTPGGIHRPPPRLGEHTEEVLREFAGFSDEEIATLRQEGAIP
ncbi:MAG: CaiB/BaiF CoA transferase family protein [Verrucomicrobiota bacterium]